MNYLTTERTSVYAAFLALFTLIAAAQDVAAQSGAEIVPADTVPLTIEGDLASRMVDGIDRFLLQQIERSRESRHQFWNYDTSSAEKFNESIEPNRQRLAQMLGLRDERIDFDAPELVGTVHESALIAETAEYKVYRIRWPVLADPAPTTADLASIHGEGLLLIPNAPAVASIVALPDANQSPEQVCGLADGIPAASQFARQLAERGCRVIVPTLMSREERKRNGRSILTNREYIYRSAFELGRHVIGYELQKVLGVIDWLEKDTSHSSTEKIGVIGYGEGGLLALYAGALDTRIASVCVSGAFGPREECWMEPLDRNVFGLLREFGGTELGRMILPRKLIVDVGSWPTATIAGQGAGPGQLSKPDVQAVRTELDAVAELAARLIDSGAMTSGVTTFYGDTDLFCSSDVLNALVASTSGSDAKSGSADGAAALGALQPLTNISPDAIQKRQQRQMEELDRHNQLLLRESPFVRQKFMAKLDTSSVETYEKSSEAYREIFRKDVIGEFELPVLPFNARSRKSWDNEKWTGHEVMLDVFPDVFAYGVLLLPKDLKPGEKRPVVVCQHGLEGRPTDVFLGDNPSYHDFAAKLCEQGFITFAPQNPYIFTDRFRTLQRKAQPLGKSLFSIIVPQHQQIVDWLQSQPFVDPDRIAFYGLSYGGKSAMRIPALVTDYCLSICSADFNEWVLKNASTRHNFSYIWTGEYEIFEWDLGSTFNYAEMAGLICPRPFMVERGHFDGVGEDDWVAYEYAKIRYLYAAKLSIGDRTEIEWFVGPHTINGKGTFRFLHQHLHFEPFEK